MSDLSHIITAGAPYQIGTSWQSSALPTPGTWYAVAGGGGIFVALRGQQEVTNKGAVSTNGYSWTDITLPSSLGRYDIGYGGGRFCTIGFNSSIVSTSTNGTAWSDINIGTSAGWSSIFRNSPGAWVAVSYQNNRVAASADGVSWSVASSLPSTRNWWKVRGSSSTYIALSLSDIYARSNGTSVANLTNPSGWSQRTFPLNLNWRSLDTNGQGTWVVVGLGSTAQDKILRSSDNGLTWNIINMPKNSNWSTVIYVVPYFVAFGYGSDVAISPDGIEWRLVSNNNLNAGGTNYQNAAYYKQNGAYDNKLVVVGFGGQSIYTSPAGGYGI